MFIARHIPTSEYKDSANIHLQLNMVRPGETVSFLSSGRDALVYCLGSFRVRYPEKTEVAAPAFICRTVPDSLRRLGLHVRYYDTAPNSVFWDPASVAQVTTSNTLAVILAPYFGLWPAATNSCLQFASSTDTILDLAQGFGIDSDEFPDAVRIFSFGIGKGVDYLGGALIAPQHVQDRLGPIPPAKTLPSLVARTRASVFRSLLGYKSLRSPIARCLSLAEERNKAERLDASPSRLMDRDIERVTNLMAAFMARVPAARARARILHQTPGVTPYCLPERVIDYERSTFLRFPLLAPTVQDRERLFTYLRRENIDVTSGAESWNTDCLPRTKDLNARLLKLPFLGNLSNDEFDYVRSKLENYGRADG